MGLIKAALGSAGGVLADQWKEYFYCESMPADVLVTKAHKKVSGRSSNKHGSENIISNGSVIAVNDGQCMLIVEQGKVVDVCAEPGEYTYDTSSEPSIFCGGLGAGVKAAFQQVGKRFTFGGEPPKDQRENQKRPQTPLRLTLPDFLKHLHTIINDHRYKRHQNLSSCIQSCIQHIRRNAKKASR